MKINSEFKRPGLKPWFFYLIKLAFLAFLYSKHKVIISTVVTTRLASIPKPPPLIHLFPTDSLKNRVFACNYPTYINSKKLAWRKFHTLWAAADIYILSPI